MTFFIPEEKILDIQNRSDIVEIVSEVVILKGAGKNYTGLCPFHSEKTPSFVVSPDRQMFHCFGCGVGGNVFNFIMKIEGISFPDAVKILAARYGVEISVDSSSQNEKSTERDKILEINKQAMLFFKNSLKSSSQGKKALAYLLEKRKISQEIISNFELGYVGDGWNNLLNYFAKKKVPFKLLEKSGLVVPRKTGNGYYDRFRNRIIFPIYDWNNQIIGFGGRVLDDALPKYLNSPETILYNKSKSLYGINRAKHKCRQSNTVYMVEGYFDLLTLHQYGIENSVATLGTALTPMHLSVLKGYAKKNILVYDSDEAGIKAAERSIDIFRKAYVEASILILPKGHDPDSYIRDNGIEAFNKMASNALSIVNFLIESAINKHGLSIEGKVRIIGELASPISSIDEPIERSLYTQLIAGKIGVEEKEVLDKIKSINDKRNKHDSGVKLVADNEYKGLFLEGKWIKFEKQIISMMLQFPEIMAEIIKEKAIDYFENDTLKSIGNLIIKNNCKPSELMSLVDAQKMEIIASLSFSQICWNREGCLKLITQFVDNRKKYDEKNLMIKIKKAVENNDETLLNKLLMEKQIRARKKHLTHSRL
ncbi:MAG: DNA primase [Desulfobacterales bacterium]|nr:DNA primase [Desulfobacterales bacterium]